MDVDATVSAALRQGRQEGFLGGLLRAAEICEEMADAYPQDGTASYGDKVVMGKLREAAAKMREEAGGA